MRYHLSRYLCFVALGASLLAAAPQQPPDATKEAEKKRVAELIRQLGHDEYFQRERAQKELVETGEPALPQLRGAVANDNPEVRDRAYRIVRTIMWGACKSKSIGLEMVPLPAGTFGMGTPKARKGVRNDEAEHLVRLSRPFLIGIHEVTQAEFQKVMKRNPSWFSPTGGGKKKVEGQETGQFPVEQVTWFDAIEFCNKLSELDGYPSYYRLAEVNRAGDSISSATVTRLGGNGYRLPTEAEWEYACRAGTTTPYHFGNIRDGKEGNFKTIISGGYGGPDVEVDIGRTTKVGSYKGNAWGLHDMHGNVAEWCWDWYESGYYENSPDTNPSGPDEGTQRVCRGGSWLVSYQNCRSATRYSLAPGGPKDHAGFRVARTP